MLRPPVQSLCCLLPVLLVAILAFPADPPRPAESEVIDAILKSALVNWKVPGVAAAVIRNGQVAYLGGHGVREVGLPEPVTPDTSFPLASCTKAFTTAAMAILVDEGKMAWDDHVRRHLDFFHLDDPLADSDVRLRDLVCHRTGLAGNDLLWYRSPWDPEEVVRRIGHVPLVSPFRAAFHYQTTMFTAAGLAAAHAASTRWEEVVRSRLLKPLGMTATTFTTTDALRSPDHATPHRPGALDQPEAIPWYAMAVPEPAGSINSTARDLSRWVRFQLGDGTLDSRRLVSAANFAETHTPQMVIPLEGMAQGMNPETVHLSYGMAWVIQDYRGHRMISHAGAIDGFRAHIALLPDDGLGIVLLNNLDRTEMNLAISNTLVDRLLGLRTRDWNAYLQGEVRKQALTTARRFRERLASRRPDTHPTRDLAAYSGQYEHPAYGIATVRVDRGRLDWNWSKFTAALEHFHYDTFTLDLDLLGHPRVLFTLDASGNVSRMKVIDVMDVEFKRLPPRGR